MTSLLQKIKELVISVDAKQDLITETTEIEVFNITSNINFIDNIDPNNYKSISYTSLKYIEDSINSFVSQIGDLTTTKQDKLTAGDNITIDENNNISSTGGSSFVGFRATGDGTFSQTIAFGQTISSKFVVYAAQANSTFDTESGYSSGTYTIPTGYTGWWETTLKLYMLGYSEGTAQVGLRQNTTTIITTGNYQGERGDFTTYVYLTEGDVMSIRQEQNSGQYSFFTTRSWWQMKFISATL